MLKFRCCVSEIPMSAAPEGDLTRRKIEVLSKSDLLSKFAALELGSDLSAWLEKARISSRRVEEELERKIGSDGCAAVEGGDVHSGKSS